MGKVLTTGAKVTCVHQGTITVPAGQSVLLVGAAPVLIDGDVEKGTITGCAPPGGAPPCKKVTATIAGRAALLKVGSKAVLLETATGTTDQGTWRVESPGQSLLDAS